MERFQDALTIMCGNKPPLKFCQMWIDGEQDELGMDPLQHWVGAQKQVPPWAQCIVTIDAARVWADTPEEGEGHKLFRESELSTWNIQVTRKEGSFYLGQVTERTEALARLAALSQYSVDEDDEFQEVAEIPGSVYGILPDDEFTVTQV